MFSITMIALLVLGSCLFVGSATGILEEGQCYGRKYSLPSDYRPPIFRGKLYFTPSSGGPKKLLLENSEVKDPRLEVSIASAKFFDRTERQGGTFSVSINGREYKVIKLKVLDCARKFSKHYGDTIQYDVGREVDFVEFVPMGDLGQLKVLWNRSDPQTHVGGRGRLKYNTWKMSDLTQSDNGYYNFWTKDTLSSINITVEEHFMEFYHAHENERILIGYPLGSGTWTVTFIRDGESGENTLVSKGKLLTRNWRFDIIDEGLFISSVSTEDSGRYEFRDSEGNLAQAVRLNVYQNFPTTVHIILIIVGIVVALIVCCCCVRKCCCKKSSSKKDKSSPQLAEAPAVYYHDGNQGEGYAGAATPAYSYQPMTSPAIGEPAASSTGPSVHHPVNIHVNPLQPEPAAQGGTGDAPPPSYTSNFLSSDPGPTFELKGVNFPSAPPLGSDSCDVYTSDKLNFL